jgi:thioredoxin-related protein
LLKLRTICELFKKEIKRNKKIAVEANNNAAISIMREWDNELDTAKIGDNNKAIRSKSEFADDYRPTLLTDNCVAFKH